MLNPTRKDFLEKRKDSITIRYTISFSYSIGGLVVVLPIQTKRNGIIEI